MDLSGVHLWLVLWKAYQSCHAAAVQSIESAELCYSDFAVLECLLHKGPTAVNTIGQKVALTSGSITTAVDRLESRGLVERQASASDRRSKIVKLTPAGRALITREFQRHRKDMEKVAGALSDKERAQLLQLLRKIGLSAHALTKVN